MHARRFVGVIFGTVALGLASHAAKIQVAVYDYAGLTKAELRAAEAEAGRYYRPEGIEFDWTRCGAHGWSEITCAKVVRPRALIINLLPQKMAARATGDADALGFAWSGTHIAGVLCARATELAEEARMPRPQVLGMVMAHELGHLLLGARAHEHSGIMVAHWTADRVVLLRAQPFFVANARRRLEQVAAQIAG